MKPFLPTAGIILILRALDLLCTYLYMPSLDQEYNPLVSICGASWPSFLIIQLILYLLIIGFAFLYYTLPPVCVKIEKLNFTDFIYVYFFGRLKPWPQRVFSIPTHLRPHLLFNGFLFISVSILVSLFAIVNNLLLLLNITPYVTFLNSHYIHFFPAVFTTIALISAHLFFFLQYRKYKNTSSLTVH